ncbi:hypothetical protein ACFQPG_10900 [Sphingomonas sp. GCM10030256]|uniref:hypothetical protein n=1 Tax=Sphingomonas sp. GCM10030256 TaxID=3273427 RepID=UPI00361C4AA7
MLSKVIGFAALLVASAPAAAAPQVSLFNEIKVVRTTTAPSGKVTTSLVDPKVVTPGDRLRLVLTYANKSNEPAKDFAVTNPMPAGVVFAGGESAGAMVSVDGGKIFGSLGALKVMDGSGQTRPAVMADVTHVRWKFANPIEAGEQGTLKFEALVK